MEGTTQTTRAQSGAVLVEERKLSFRCGFGLTVAQGYATILLRGNFASYRKVRLVETKIGKFTFAIPEGHPDAGKKIEKAFEFGVVSDDAEATKVIADKKWKLHELVSDVLKANARSSAYQAALLPYRPSEVSPEDIKERMVRDFIRLGISEDAARKQVDAMLANAAAPVTE